MGITQCTNCFINETSVLLLWIFFGGREVLFVVLLVSCFEFEFRVADADADADADAPAVRPAAVIQRGMFRVTAVGWLVQDSS